MADEVKPEIKPEVKVETKVADKPVETVAKAPVENKPAAYNKIEQKTETKEEVNPAEELKTLLDEAGEVKLDKDGKPIVEQEAKVIPEKYEFKLPEGVSLEEAQLAIITPVFKELGLDNSQAQKLLDLQLAYNKQNEEAHVTQFDQYVENLKKESKEFFGTKLPDVMRNVARARDQFIHKELQEKLNVSGLANDKDVLVMLDKLGRTVGEGKFVEGKRSSPAAGTAGKETPTGKEVTLNDVYPSMAKT